MTDSQASAAPVSLTGGTAIARSLLDHRVDTVFALPGAQIYGLCDGLAQASAQIRTIGARHEQTVGYMAYGYARASARPGVCVFVPGPGVLNVGAALLTAQSSCAPVLALTSDVTTSFKNRQRGQLHELGNQLEVLRSISKWADHVEQGEQIPWMMARAFQELQSGRQGVAALQTPWDVLSNPVSTSRVAPLARLPDPEVDPGAIARAAAILAGARSPMIFVGSGALDAAEAVTALAEELSAPVVSLRGGRGVVSDEHPLGFTVAAGARMWAQADVALVIGSRFELLDMRWRHRPAGLKIIRIDIDPAEVRRLAVDVSITANAGPGASALLRAMGAKRLGDGAQRRERLADIKAAAAVAIRSVQPQMDYLDAIRAVLPRDGFMVDELSQMGFASIFGFPVYQPRTLVSSGYQGTLGFGFPTALGVKAAFPKRAVISVTGDGGFMFAAQELATAVQYRLNVVTIVFNNNAYGNVLRDQQRAYDGRVLAATLVNPDFVKFAESFGVAAQRVGSPAALRPALERALKADAPALIEVAIPTGSDGDPWPFIHPPFPDQTPF